MFKLLRGLFFVLLLAAPLQAQIVFTGAHTVDSRFDPPSLVVSSLHPNYPTNQTGDLILAWINITNQFEVEYPPVVVPPSGWQLVIDNEFYGIGSRRAVYWKLGDGSEGPMTWGFDCPIRGNIDLIVYSGVNPDEPIADSSFRNNLQTDMPYANAVTISQSNCMLVCGWFEASTCVSFTTEDFTDVLVDYAGLTGSAIRPTLIVQGMQSTAGNSGVKIATSFCLEEQHFSFAQAIMIALAPSG